MLDLALVAKHLEVHLVFLVQPGHVLPADLREIFPGHGLTGSSTIAPRTTVDSPLPLPLLPSLLVEAGQAVPVRPQPGQVEPPEQPVSVLLQGLQLQDGRVADVAGDTNLLRGFE